MAPRRQATMDGNEAVARVSYKLNEVIAIYPITPASPMGEWADSWASEGQPNLWGTVPTVVEMQSEGGAAGAVHGSLQGGGLTTTYTASQGLLLMLPNMFKIAGELTPLVIHVAARSVAAQALSIFADHSDVMAARGTGFAFLCAGSVQEAMDFAVISQAVSLRSRIPFVHFFDGFRTSHEIATIEPLLDDDLRQIIDDDLVRNHRNRSLRPDAPVIRGTAQNPDVFFQGRETVNPFYGACPAHAQAVMDRFARITGRVYHLFDYHGAPDAERVVVLMGSGAETAHETVEYLSSQGEKVGVLKVRMYRPFDGCAFVRALPETVKALAVLDRTKEPGSAGEPLYLDCSAALLEDASSGEPHFRSLPTVVGGRYGLGSKEFTPSMVRAILDELRGSRPKNHFTVGIRDDVSGASLEFDPSWCPPQEDVLGALFFGLGSDGTVGANKNTIKIIGEHSGKQVQGFFVYDSKKSGAVTVSHLRFGDRPIRSTYLLDRASFVACHHPVFLRRNNILEQLSPGGVFLLNSTHGKDQVWHQLPREYQQELQNKKARFFVIDASEVARSTGMGGRINTIMQVCFFSISGVLPEAEAVEAIKDSIHKTYGNKGEEVVAMNLRAVDSTLEHLHEVPVPEGVCAGPPMRPLVPETAPEFVRNVTGPLLAGCGDSLPVSAIPADGTWPTATSQWDRHNIASEIPIWDPDICIQCGKCAMVCPHAVIRVKVYEPEQLEGSPEGFRSRPARDRTFEGLDYTIQVAPEECTGCGICVDVCPAKNKAVTRFKAINMKPHAEHVEAESANWQFFKSIPEFDRRRLKVTSIREQQIQQPLFEFSGACAGCGETPYLKLVSQLFGDRAVIANATGCSSIYGGNLPTTPWAKTTEGRGPAWSNSLFEDNAEFGLGLRVAYDKQREMARELLKELAPQVGPELAEAILSCPETDEAEIHEQRQRVSELSTKLKSLEGDRAGRLGTLVESLCKRSVWIVGGDGWAYDIGFGGLDHVLASGRNVNVLVLDTEVYSNTGGQMSKATPRAAVAKFAAGGKRAPKKDLGMIAMTYGTVYVASVAIGAKDEHTLRTFLEAESYPGPSLIIAYSHCIAHGINMTTAMQNQKAAVDTGQWLLYRYDPRRAEERERPLSLDSRAAKRPLETFLYMENRFKMLRRSQPEAARALLEQAQREVNDRRKLYEHLAAREA